MALNLVERIDDAVSVRRVLVSVSDKTGLDTLVPALVESVGAENLTLFSTGGTYRVLREILGETRSRQCLTAVSDYTGQPEMQGGLVKTLDFRIYLGLLSETYNPDHERDLRRVGAVPIDLVIVNLYPFEQTVAGVDCTAEKARANIDIGGPCMVRAAAKNYLRVGVVTDPEDYSALAETLRANHGAIGWRLRYEWMRKAFRHTADYDAAIAEYFAGREAESVRPCYRT